MAGAIKTDALTGFADDASLLGNDVYIDDGVKRQRLAVRRLALGPVQHKVMVVVTVDAFDSDAEVGAERRSGMSSTMRMGVGWLLLHLI